MAKKYESLTACLVDAVDQYVSDHNMDAQATMNSLAIAVEALDKAWKRKITEEEIARNKAEFDQAFKERQEAYALLSAQHPYPFELKSQWKSSGRDIVKVGNLSGSIFSQEASNGR